MVVLPPDAFPARTGQIASLDLRLHERKVGHVVQAINTRRVICR